MYGNISGGNQPLHANYGNFNRSHTMLIQGKTHERWEEWCAKLMRGGREDLQRHFCKSPLPPPMSPPLDQHRVAPIEVSIVCTEGLVSSWYVPFMYCLSLFTCLFIFDSWYMNTSVWFEKCLPWCLVELLLLKVSIPHFDLELHMLVVLCSMLKVRGFQF
jgi:hypothetical protein